jgi:hypothetical protein
MHSCARRGGGQPCRRPLRGMATVDVRCTSAFVRLERLYHWRVRAFMRWRETLCTRHALRVICRVSSARLDVHFILLDRRRGIHGWVHGATRTVVLPFHSAIGSQRMLKGKARFAREKEHCRLGA